MSKRVRLKIKSGTAETGWQDYYRNASGLMQSVMNGRLKNTPVIAYNVTAVAMKKYLTALLMYYGNLSRDKTLPGILSSVKKIMGFPLSIERKILFIDSFPGICKTGVFSERKPDEMDILILLSCWNFVKKFVDERLPL